MIRIKKVGRWGVFEDTPPKKLESALFNRLAYQKEGWEHAVRMKRMNIIGSWIRFYNKKKRCFPWGLADKVQKIMGQWYKQTKEEYEICYGEVKFNGVEYPIKKIKGLRPYQVDAINGLFKNNGGILAIPTGGGKTLTAINFLKKVNYKLSLIIVHTVDLKNQWIEELDKNKLSNYLVVTYQSLNGKNNKVNLKAYDIIIFDECHHVSADSLFKIAMKCDDAILIGLSATPYRAYRPETMKIIAALGEISYQISCRELIEQGYLCDAEVRIVENVGYPEIEYWDTYHDVVDKCIVKNTDRNDTIMRTAASESKKGITLILVDIINHGQSIFNTLNAYAKYNVVFVHGSSKNRKEIFKDIKNNKYDIIIASKIYGEGVNFPNLKTLILAGGGKSSVATVQKIGRILRLFPGKDKAIIYDFNDDVKYLSKHFQARYEIYKENGFEVRMI